MIESASMGLCHPGMFKKKSGLTRAAFLGKSGDSYILEDASTPRSTLEQKAPRIYFSTLGNRNRIMPDLGPCLFLLDVGHGNCAVLCAEDDGVVVIDVGRRNVLPEFLLQQGIRRIRTIYLSHADQDHVGALVGLLASKIVSIEKVVVNGDSSKDTEVWKDLVYTLDNAHSDGILEFKVGLVSGDGECLRNIEVRVLDPSRSLTGIGVGGMDRSGREITSNSISAVIRASVSGQHVALLPADVDEVGLDDLLRREIDLNAPILVYPHHGGRPGSSGIRQFAEKLLGATSPEVVVFSIGRGRYNTPNPETVRVLREVLPNARIVCTQLSEHCSKEVPPASPTHLSGLFALGRAARACCGGTIVVPLDQVENIEPRQDHHTGFIRSNAETPLCLGNL